MTKSIILLYFTLLGLMFTSCTTSRMLKSSVNPMEVKEVLYVHPMASISMIERGNVPITSDSLAAECIKRQIAAMKKNKAGIKVSDVVMISDPSVMIKLEKEILFLMEKGLETARTTDKRALKLPIPPTLDSITTHHGSRFNLLSISNGFTRGKGNYANAMAEGIGLSIVTLGIYSFFPIKARTSISVMIIDAKEKNITFFRKAYPKEREPLKPANLEQQISDIFYGYKQY